MELFITDPGIYAPQARRVIQINSLRVPNGHIGLIGPITFFLIHADDFLNLRFQILPIGIILIAVLFIIVGILSIFTGIILNAVKRD